MDRRTLKIGHLLIASLVLWIAAPVSAAIANPIQVTVTGQVTTVSPVLASAFSVGQGMSATFTYESSTSGVPTLITLVAYPGALTGGAFSIGSYNGTTSTGNINVANNDPSFNDDVSFANSGVTGASIGTHDPFRFLVQLSDSSQTALGSTSLPLVLPPLGNFNVKRWQLAFTPVALLGSEQTGVEGSLTSITLTPVTVPEPSELALIVVSTLLIACRARSTQKLPAVPTPKVFR